MSEHPFERCATCGADVHPHEMTPREKLRHYQFQRNAGAPSLEAHPRLRAATIQAELLEIAQHFAREVDTQAARLKAADALAEARERDLRWFAATDAFGRYGGGKTADELVENDPLLAAYRELTS